MSMMMTAVKSVLVGYVVSMNKQQEMDNKYKKTKKWYM